jgi:hypothetical protein
VAVTVGMGVAAGGGAASCWLPRRAAMMTAAIAKETSRIMAPRATSSCRPCRQFMLPSALNSGLGSHGLRANFSRLARSCHSGRGTTKPSGICGTAQVQLIPISFGTSCSSVDRTEANRYDPAHFTFGGASNTRVCDRHCAEKRFGSSASPAGAGNPEAQAIRMRGCIRH